MIWLVKWLVIGRDGTFQIQKHLIWNAYYFKMLLLMKTIHYFQWGFVGHQLCVRSFWVPQGQKKEGRKEIYDKARQTIKKQRHHFANSLYGQSCGFPSSHVQMWELDHRESWAPKNWSFWDVVLEKTLDSLLSCKEIKPVHPKGNQFWIFIGRTDAKALIFWSPDVRNQFIGKDPDAGKDWRQEEKGVAKDVMVR